MKLGYFRALRIFHQTFRHHPAGARAHIVIRFVTCPFLRTLDVISPGSRILDIGAGHGIYASLALEQGASEVVMVEPDLRKSLLPFQDPRLRVIAAFDEAIRGNFDTVVLYDATYRMSLDERDRLYRRIFERLRPGGLFILKDMDPDRRLKMSWARFQEFLSDRLLGISIGKGFIYESTRDLEARLKRIGFEQFTARAIDAWYPHPHILYTTRRPDTRR